MLMLAERNLNEVSTFADDVRAGLEKISAQALAAYDASSPGPT